MGYNQRREFRHIVTEIIDLCIVALSYYASLFVFNFLFDKTLKFEDIGGILPIVLVVSLFFFEVFGVFYDEHSTYLDIVINFSVAVFFTIILSSVIVLALNMDDFATKIFPIALVIQVSLYTIIEKFLLRYKHRRTKIAKYIFIGNENEYKRIQSSKEKNYHLLKVTTRIESFADMDSYELIDYDGIIVGSTISEIQRIDIVDFGIQQNKDVLFVPDYMDIAISQAKMMKINSTPMFRLNQYRLSPNELMIKRVLDIMLSTVAVIFFIPIMLIISILIKITSEGPILYKQTRVTQNGKTFTLLKFRTMIVNAESKTGAILSKPNDHRITKLGRVLRSTRLDEIPQLFNILSGSMSIVGPRPERPEFTSRYIKDVSYYSERFTVKAGLTGLAQIMGDYHTEAEDKLKYDLLYISNYSVLLDAYILLRTVVVVFGRKGS